MIRYLASIDRRKMILWFAFLWYVAIVTCYASADPALWARAGGIAVIVGTILTLNAVPRTGRVRDLGFWPVFRFFLIPFCVSSFSTLTTNRAFFLIFPPNLNQTILAVAVIIVFIAGVLVARRLRRPPITARTVNREM
ncbi:MAG: hypothetical protein Q7S40_33965 [Opitutaceae bacterium]|nr:hypothetical protein [Opitutaceae bacterium]